jgi:hypothetical protein
VSAGFATALPPPGLRLVSTTVASTSTASEAGWASGSSLDQHEWVEKSFDLLIREEDLLDLKREELTNDDSDSIILMTGAPVGEVA